MHHKPLCSAAGAALAVPLAVLLAVLLAAAPANSDSGGESSRAEKFEELESRHADDPQRLALTKARWLTERGNAAGQAGELDDAVSRLREAVEIKQDYFPAHLSLALAHLSDGQHERALRVINEAPRTMQFGDSEVAGFEHDVYYVRMLIYDNMADHEKGLAVAREGLEVLDNPEIKEERRRLEELGVVGEGSGSQIYGVLERYVKIRESRDSN